MGAAIDCRCLPGFNFVHPGYQTSGCERNSSIGDVYTIEELGSTRWEDQPYMVLSFSDIEQCKNACLEDLNCQVAVFTDQSCSKQRLPLRYGRRVTTSNIVLIKKVDISSTPPAADTTVPKGSRKKGRIVILIIGVLITALGSILLVISVLVLWKHNAWAYKRMNELNGDAERNDNVAPRPYAYEEDEPSLRPSMKKVLLMLEGTVEIPVPPSPKSFLSTI
ncbi:hypothetical protein M0R45_005422 [Rubus argutus]|uniref:Apple domain-containing protein n=1 Tax=Rubus argutus TaxID=59490 RepID=A0AAW1YMN8_RUBAR